MTKICDQCGGAFTPNPKLSRIRREHQRFCSNACRLTSSSPPPETRWTKKDGENPAPVMAMWPCRSQPGGCGCHCHAIARGKAESTRLPRDAWLTLHDAVIKERVKAGVPPAEIATELSERFPVPRTAHAVRRRIVQLGISTRDGWWSRWEASKLLGLSKEALARIEEAGAITPQPFASWRRYREADIHRLIRAQAGLTIDPRRVKHPAWKSLAEVSARVNARSA